MTDWGDIPSWLGAVGTIGATSVAVWLAAMERNRAVEAERERDQLRDLAQGEVASRVVAWLEEAPAKGQRTFLRPAIWRVMVQNGSDQPVLNICASIVHGDGQHKQWIKDWNVIPPLHTVHADQETELQSLNEQPYVALSFEDPMGRQWHRGERGQLTLTGHLGHAGIGYTNTAEAAEPESADRSDSGPET